MSFGGRTPESLLPRSDSKNPASTCKGLTTNGRPCRRALANPSTSSPLPPPSRETGVIAILDETNAAAFYCWQHKDQAESLAAQSDQKTSLYLLKEKSSIDTLADRVGVLDLDEQLRAPNRVRHKRRRDDGQSVTRRDTLPTAWQGMQSPLMTIPETVKPARPSRYQNDYGRSNVKFSWACCIQTDKEDHYSSRPQPQRHRRHGYTSPAPMKIPTSGRDQSHKVPHKPLIPQQPQMAHLSPTPNPLRPPPTPANIHSNSQTQTLLSLIPASLSPQTTSALLSELSRPISSHDEAGYIYIFWLTPESEASKPDDETASSLLDSDDENDYKNTSQLRHQRTSAALSRYASVRKTAQPRTILLKIGRAANVHRRLSQWTKQCGQNITLVRFYPYTPTSTSGKPAGRNGSGNTNMKTNMNGKVPHVHRVERLVHLELSENRAQKDPCEQCGREHREWFEIEATRQGLRVVDEVVRRWVGWARGADGDNIAMRATMRGKEGENDHNDVNDDINDEINGRGNADRHRRKDYDGGRRDVLVPKATAVDGYY
jgi:Meiotically up-regulated gene 113